MPDSRRAIIYYFSLVYLVLLAIAGSFLGRMENPTPGTTVYAVMAVLSYALLYLSPALLLTRALDVLLAARKRPSRRKTVIICTAAAIAGTGTILFLVMDRYLFGLYGYHFNASVWNLIRTPGGIASLGSTLETQIWAAGAAGLLLLINIGVVWTLHAWQDRLQHLSFPKRPLVWTVVGLSLMFVAEEGIYTYARFTQDDPVLRAASIIPLHLDPVSKTLIRHFALKTSGLQEWVRIPNGQINYPIHPLQTAPLKKYPNIVWLTAESFRWDLLDPEITPNLWKFSKKAVNFKQHYSGGNRTRMGMFSMFYGLYAPYWYSFQEQKIRPQLMKQITDHNYQLEINTSQSFSYPELRDTLFTQIPEANLQELQEGPPWQRDHQNISDIGEFIRKRDTNRPFFTFMFFESTHAPYNFPDTAVIRPDYTQSVNYLKLDSLIAADQIQQLHNRYINAAHHVDAEVGRILDLLEQEHLLDDTIVLFTGDHGEEFMENGHWGHGHNEVFPEQQIHVPLVLWIPGQEARQIDSPTSHNQIPATILPYLGVTSPPRDYASEEGLFAPFRTYRVIGSYDYLAVIDDKDKLSFPFTRKDYFHYIFNDGSDHLIPVAKQQQLLLDKKPELDAVAAECLRFTAKNQELASSQRQDAIRHN
jgi:membrane-anchored protein YejM (alkaline phosphatase superfamily)